MSLPKREQPIPAKFEKLTQVKRGYMTSHLPKLFAGKNAALIASLNPQGKGAGV